MPIAGHQDAQLLHYLLQSKPTGLHNVAGSLPPHSCAGENGAACTSEVVRLSGAASVASNSSESAQYFSTNSPPLINLSPNLSPTSELQRTSPFYDLRETTRRRGYLGMLNRRRDKSDPEGQQRPHPASLCHPPPPHPTTPPGPPDPPAQPHPARAPPKPSPRRGPHVQTIPLHRRGAPDPSPGRQAPREGSLSPPHPPPRHRISNGPRQGHHAADSPAHPPPRPKSPPHAAPHPPHMTSTPNPRPEGAPGGRREGEATAGTRPTHTRSARPQPPPAESTPPRQQNPGTTSSPLPPTPTPQGPPSTNSPGSPKTPGTRELTPTPQVPPNATAPPMHPALAATTPDRTSPSNTCQTDTTGAPSRPPQHIQTNTRPHHPCPPHAHTQPPPSPPPPSRPPPPPAAPPRTQHRPPGRPHTAAPTDSPRETPRTEPPTQ